MFSIPLKAWSQTDRNLDVAVTIANSEINLAFGGVRRETSLDSLELRWYESLLSHLDGGVSLGYIDSRQASNPIAAGQATSGEYLEIGLRAYYYRGEILNLSSDLTYRYSQTRNRQLAQDINWTWHQATVSLQGGLQAGQFLEFFVGVSVTAIDGQETASGAISQILDFREERSLSGQLGAQIILDHTGHIGIKIGTGSLRGGQIYFQRWF